MDSYCSLLANTDIVDELCDFIITKLLSFFIKIDAPSVITDLKKRDQQRNFPLLPFWGLVNSVVGQPPSKLGHPSFHTQSLRYFGRELFMAENPH